MKRIWWGVLGIVILAVLAGGFWFFWQASNSQKENSENGGSGVVTEAVFDQDLEKTAVPAEPAVAAKVSFFFGGDMMFDRYVYHTFKNIGLDKIFEGMDKSIFGEDIVFANLEGPISAETIADDYPGRSLIFNFPPETVGVLGALGINGVSLANNHTLNAGNSGFLATKQLLTAAGIKEGGSQNGFDESSVIRYESEVPVSIIVVDLLAYSNLEKVAEAIRGEKAAGRLTVVFPHWGTEYALKHSASQAVAGHKFIDAGADLVIGSHPHVVEDVETYNNRAIFYSLGNFVFDQMFSEATQEGLLITGEFSEGKLSLKLNPIKAEKMRLRLMNAEEKSEILTRINGGSESINLELN